MKRKSLIKLISFALIFSAVAVIAFVIIFSKGTESDNRIKVKIEHYEVPDFNWSMEVSTSDGIMNLSEIAAALGDLTNEDGTGEINLNMTWQEIAAVLDEKGIQYEVDGSWTEADAEYSSDGRSIFTADGSYYRPYYGLIDLHQTKKGLKVGEPLSRAIELYGEPDKSEANPCYDNVVTYYYDMGKLYCEATDSERTVILAVTCGDDIVVTIKIRFLMDFDEGVFLNNAILLSATKNSIQRPTRHKKLEGVTLNKKNYTVLLLAICIMLILTACGDNNSVNNPSTEPISSVLGIVSASDNGEESTSLEEQQISFLTAKIHAALKAKIGLNAEIFNKAQYIYKLTEQKDGLLENIDWDMVK